MPDSTPNLKMNEARVESAKFQGVRTQTKRSLTEGGDAEISAKQTKSGAKWLILPVILAILLVFFLFNKTAVLDTFKGLGYAPTPAMTEIRSSLGLTADGQRIFNATHPTLASRDEFNDSCESHDEAVSVLGCYTGDRIYVYNVEDASLAGIRESTSAHEFLHAVWSRLSSAERSELIPLLESVYKAHPEMQETVEAYDESERLGELYVRVGTQVADLPDALESHYARFFSDQDKVANFYASYISPFNELRREIEALEEELMGLNREIESRSAALDARLSTFEAEVDKYNSCRNTAGCFNDATIAVRYAALAAEQSAINAENDAINALIDSYNTKVDVYNNSIAKNSTLQNLINSNSPTSAVEE